jgi:taurine dioxygenase
VSLAPALTVRPVSPTIGAEISGVDISRPLEPGVVDAIGEALDTHHVVFFRDQSLTAAQQADFARQFGTVTEAHPVLPSVDESPEVLAIDGKVDRASWWHTDVTFLQTPAMASVLYNLSKYENDAVIDSAVAGDEAIAVILLFSHSEIVGTVSD